MTQFAENTYIYDQMKKFGEILKLVGFKMFTRKFLKLKWTREWESDSHPTAWELTEYDRKKRKLSHSSFYIIF